MENILVPIDFSDTTDEVIDRAVSLARAWESRLWLIHVVSPPSVLVGENQDPRPIRRCIAEKLQKTRLQLRQEAGELRRQGLRITSLVVQGGTVKSIAKHAKKIPADMIVIGSHGDNTLYRYLLGSVSEGVLEETNCPVLIVPSRQKRFTAAL
jgi:nucleotide-binding universal stress UspA family protein